MAGVRAYTMQEDMMAWPSEYGSLSTTDGNKNALHTRIV